MSPRYEQIAEFLCNRIEDSKPSLSPDKYPKLDPYLTGFENGLSRAQHIVRASARHALTIAAEPDASTPEPQRPQRTWWRRLRCWYWQHPDAAYVNAYCSKCGARLSGEPE